MVFIKNVEDFVCEHCGTAVTGNGYTNHCPKCLFSKHVDVQPGDRAETCGGMMSPVSVEGSSPKYLIVQVCGRCKKERRIGMADNDDMDAVLAIIRKRANAPS